MPRDLLNYKSGRGGGRWFVWNDEFWDTAPTAPDQFAWQRVVWAIFQYIPVSMGQANGSRVLQYARRNALGNYSKLLVMMSINPHMGFI